jgi:hypothetical protein
MLPIKTGDPDRRRFLSNLHVGLSGRHKTATDHHKHARELGQCGTTL